AVLDSSGRLVFVDRDRLAGFISDIDPPGVDHVELVGDGTARIGLSGPAFGVFDLEGASDLGGWVPTGRAPVTIGGDGRASFSGVDADAARFWRGIYRTK
ncbi:MAG: hypothetical protein ACR2RV_24545, partial [Verrucomicrobiales bacterium]